MSTDTQTLDIPKVSAYLEKHLEGFEGPLEVSKFQAGQSNPTFLLKTPSRNYVLRRKPPGVLLKSAHAVDREFRVQKALQDTDVPVSKMHLLCEDDDVIGTSFYVMDFVPGRVFTQPQLEALPKDQRADLYNDKIDTLAKLRMVHLPGTTAQLQIGSWKHPREDVPNCGPLSQRTTCPRDLQQPSPRLGAASEQHKQLLGTLNYLPQHAAQHRSAR